MIDKFNNVEYFRVYNGSVKGANPVVTWTGADVNGLTRSEIAHKIADLLGREGLTSYSFKLVGGGKWQVGKVVAFYKPDEAKEKRKNLSGMNSEDIKQEYKEIYTLKAELLAEEATYLKGKISLLQAENSDLKKQLDNEGGDPGGLVTFFTQLTSGVMQKKNLASDQRQTGDIPAEINAVLNQIDYMQLTPERIRELAAKLQQALKFFNLPIKQQG